MRKLLPHVLLALVIMGCSLLGVSIPEPTNTSEPGVSAPELTSTANLPIYTSQPTITARSSSRSMETLFLDAQQKALSDPDLRYVIDYYGPGCNGVCVLSASGPAKSIVDVGEDFVCLNDVLMDNQPPSFDVCIPYSSIVRVGSLTRCSHRRSSRYQ